MFNQTMNDPPPNLKVPHTLYKWFFGELKEIWEGGNHFSLQTVHFCSAEFYSHIGIGWKMPVLQEWFL